MPNEVSGTQEGELPVFNEENLRKVIQEMLGEGYKNPAFRVQLRDPSFAKQEIAKRIQKPEKWEDRVIVFHDDENPNDNYTAARFTADRHYEIENCSWTRPPR